MINFINSWQKGNKKAKYELAFRLGRITVFELNFCACAPKPEVSKMEFQMKDQMVRDAVLNTEKNVEKLDERMIRMEEKMDQLILR